MTTKKHLRVVCALFVLLSVATASGTASALSRYTYTGNVYSIASGVYDTSMNITGWLEMSSPVPPNSPLTDFAPAVSAFSFSDGAATLTWADSHLFLAQLATDGNGDIVDALVVVQRPLPVPLNQRATMIIVTSAGVQATSLVCEDVDPTGICNTFTWGIGPLDGHAVSLDPGTWQAQHTAPTPAPTMTEWGMVIFIALAGLASFIALRRKTLLADG